MHPLLAIIVAFPLKVDVQQELPSQTMLYVESNQDIEKFVEAGKMRLWDVWKALANGQRDHHGGDTLLITLACQKGLTPKYSLPIGIHPVAESLPFYRERNASLSSTPMPQSVAI